MIGLGVGVSPTTHGFKPIRVNETVGEGAVEEWQTVCLTTEEEAELTCLPEELWSSSLQM